MRHPNPKLTDIVESGTALVNKRKTLSIQFVLSFSKELNIEVVPFLPF